MKKIVRLCICVILMAGMHQVHAQNTKIHHFEYFFDTDPGFGNGNSLLVSPAVVNVNNYSFNPDITALSRGLHTLYLRAVDSAYRWSQAIPNLIFKELIVTNNIPNAVAAEYFFDTDPGFGAATPASVTAGQTVSFTFDGAINLLSNGLHILYVRVRDANGKWSSTTNEVFFKEPAINNAIPNIVAAEYFFDADPGFGAGTPASITAGQLVTFNFDGAISGKPRGLHQLFVRTKDANGKWSITTEQTFYYEPIISAPIPNVVAAEYFFDADPGFGNAINAPLTAGQTVAININAAISALSNGLHNMYVRTKDANGKWSITTNQVFFKEPAINNAIPNVVAAEYFFDTDPGFGNGNSISVSAAQMVVPDFNGNINALSNGLHNLYVRAKDANGKWSITTNEVFFKEPAINNAIPNIVAAEYYIDSDPGFGNGTAFTVSPQAQAITQAFNIPASGLAKGLHQMFTRVKDANGKWSLTNRSVFYYEKVVATNPLSDLVYLEWFWSTDPGFGNANRVSIPAGNNGAATSIVFDVPVPSNFSGTKQNLYVRVVDDWSLTTVRLVDFTSIVLPVTLLEFSAQVSGNKVVAKWATSQEKNSAYFDVERSEDGTRFSKVGSVVAKGNSNVSSDYSFDDNTPAIGFNYYRLKQVDKDGAFKYSAVVKIFFGGGREGIYSYPNPVRDQLMVMLPVSVLPSGNVTIQLYDNKGAMVLQKKVSSRLTQIGVSNLASGNYIISVRDQSGKQLYQEKIIKE
ncbi:MAG: T9SS type A sorting domain-containing protein [Bacteroidetes bacterium]|nr:T9SS type A sorting domain-containing protein [Bacteroidota bacterium]